MIESTGEAQNYQNCDSSSLFSYSPNVHSLRTTSSSAASNLRLPEEEELPFDPISAVLRTQTYPSPRARETTDRERTPPHLSHREPSSKIAHHVVNKLPFLRGEVPGDR